MRLIAILLSSCLIYGCADAPKTAPAPEPAAAPKIGVVALVQQKRERGITESNWKTAILGIVKNEDLDANVSKTVYEVTVFFDTGQQEVVILEQDPQLKPGQRVRVTGKKIEVLGAH